MLIEKPLATSAAEGEAVVAATGGSGRVAEQSATIGVFLSAVPLMKELLNEGYFGALRRFAYQFGVVGGWAPVSAYNLHRQSAGGGVLTVEGSHFLDRMIHWFRHPGQLRLFRQFAGQPEATVVCRFGYGGGAKLAGEARLSKTVPRREGFALETATGSVIFREEDDALLFHPADRPRLELRLSARSGASFGKAGTHALQLADFVAACRTGQQPRVPVAEGLETQRLIDRLYAARQPLAQASDAARSGRRVA